ncbi:MAG: FIG003573: hypothetical protein, partial [uncultured Microvirga sp.]
GKCVLRRHRRRARLGASHRGRGQGHGARGAALPARADPDPDRHAGMEPPRRPRGVGGRRAGARARPVAAGRPRFRDRHGAAGLVARLSGAARPTGQRRRDRVVPARPPADLDRRDRRADGARHRPGLGGRLRVLPPPLAPARGGFPAPPDRDAERCAPAGCRADAGRGAGRPVRHHRAHAGGARLRPDPHPLCLDRRQDRGRLGPAAAALALYPGAAHAALDPVDAGRRGRHGEFRRLSRPVRLRGSGRADHGLWHAGPREPAPGHRGAGPPHRAALGRLCLPLSEPGRARACARAVRGPRHRLWASSPPRPASGSGASPRTAPLAPRPLVGTKTL